MRRLLALLFWLSACAGAPEVQVEVVAAGVVVRADRPMTRVELLDDAGAPVLAQALPGSPREATVLAPLGDVVSARVITGGGAVVVPVVVPDASPVRVSLQAPVGQDVRRVRSGEVVRIAVSDAGAPQAALVLDADHVTDAAVWVADRQVPVRFDVPGERVVVPFALQGDVPIAVEAGGVRWSAHIVAEALPREVISSLLTVTEARLPADADGLRDWTRPQDVVEVPAPWWANALVRLGLGQRARSDQAPWTHQAIHLHNAGAADVVVSVRAVVWGPDGGPAPAFRSRVRSAQTSSGAVSVLARVPAGGDTVAVLPFFVDRSRVLAGVYQRRVRVTALGDPVPLVRVAQPLVVRRGSTWLSAMFAGALVTSGLGVLLLVLRTRAWLVARSTTELVTIALFGSLTFVVAAASQLVGFGVASVLGPFAPFVTGLVDDVIKVVILATLVSLVPRVGVVGLATLVGYLLRGLALGSFHPVDVLYFGNAVLWYELALWAMGVTRGPDWRDAPRWGRWLRLWAAFGVANAVCMGLGLVTTMVLYRLFLAGWYVIALIALPGWLYVGVGAWLAVDFSASLRKVAS